jgi:hypothetical protein
MGSLDLLLASTYRKGRFRRWLFPYTRKCSPIYYFSSEKLLRKPALQEFPPLRLMIAGSFCPCVSVFFFTFGGKQVPSPCPRLIAESVGVFQY